MTTLGPTTSPPADNGHWKFEPGMIVRLMADRAMPLAELARRLRTSRSTISAWLGGGQLPSMALLMELCHALNASPTEFFVQAKDGDAHGGT